MGVRFAELDWQRTPMGDISLRRRIEPVSGRQIHEVKLGDEFLMSDLFTAGEEALATLGLAASASPAPEVVVGGLGLGHTAVTALQDSRVRALLVVEALEQVISWHRRELVPLGGRLTGDPRCRLVHGDFFAMAAGDGFDPHRPRRQFDAVLLDIDHSPDHLLRPDNAGFYTEAGLQALSGHLRPGGVFALWSDDPPRDSFRGVLAQVFTDVEAHVVRFPNPVHGGTAANTVYVSRRPAG
ncbi:spermidine synthase [Streptomyces sp. YIM 98790]|uniref:spermidine synthase n=1 Tax=Streptomyces sp. YIM 98790 TaxID=2689077 RepID=UPI00140C055C|nr:spermidine synthase [Streptomyces sp. YIM 98790]